MGFVENGNILINDEHKVRIPLSEKAKIIIEEDMLNWNIKNNNSFINTVFEYYKEDALSSLSRVMERKEDKLRLSLRKICKSKKETEALIDTILSDEQKALKKEAYKYISEKNSGQLYTLNKKNFDYLISDECKEEKYYNMKPSKYIRAVIEEYCALPYIEREKIFFRNYYEQINLAIKASKKIKIVTSNSNNKYYIEPYKIISDSLNTRNYLICYSGLSEKKSNSIITSVSIARIASIKTLREEYHFTIPKIKKIEERLSTNTPMYLIGRHKQIRVRLSKKGQKMFQKEIYNRPHNIFGPSNDGIYTFDCTTRQAFKYFYSFGKEAEIISPDSLRDKFKKELFESLKLYE